MNFPSQLSMPLEDWPLLTHDLPGSRGTLQELEDFIVEELPAYLPQGEGEHCFAFIEKKNLTTPEAIRRICNQLGISNTGVGYAGLKDKRGITRQWISFQGISPEKMQTIQHEDLKVILAKLHRNKLRTGHLKGNRFEVQLRDTTSEALSLAQASCTKIQQSGLPNYYGAQRFGHEGRNVSEALKIIKTKKRTTSDRIEHRLLLSALQSYIFNKVLAQRLRDNSLQKLIGGEVLQKIESGGLFVSEDLEEDGRRLASGELVITGPICGPRMVKPKEDSPALKLEADIIQSVGVSPEDFGAFGRLARGGRRPLMVRVSDLKLEEPAPGFLRISFVLPPGSYATVLLREVTKKDLR